jgi:carboxymethylenebutenolidase
MRLIRRLLTGLLLLVLALALFLAGSIAWDSLTGSGRVEAIANTTIDHAAGPAIATFLAVPEGEGPFPAVIMLHEFWGMKSEIAGKAEALADEGYVVIAPDMFRGNTTAWLPRAIWMAVTTPQDEIAADIEAVFQWAKTQPEIDPERIVVMGFCFGGGQALQFSLGQPEIAATGIFYGSLASDPALLGQLPGPVLGIFGQLDRAPSPADVAAFAAGLKSAGIPHEISVYPGVGHAFVTDIEAIRRGGAQGEAWAQFLDWLQATVG